ncbi:MULTISPECIES: hypothetical protein [unclassified Dietzia]|uniref:hypothetical protein n=1 Tax=unclassified Dietzia TaxID=2617939 RepID=UPI0012E94379|nr:MULTISPECIES: hypothetical protein [unclassified Dietzia]
MVARESTPEAVGAWAVGYAFYTFVLAISRSSISTTAIISQGGHTAELSIRGSEQDKDAVSTAVFAASGIAMVIAVFGLVIQGDLGFYIVLFAVALPMLIWQDALRFVTIRQGKLARTSVIDLTWLVCQVAIGALLVEIFDDGRMVTIGWMVAAAISLAVATMFVSPRVSLARAANFYRRHRSTIGGLFTESALGAGVANLQPAILGVFIGLASTGYFRGALSLLGIAGAVVMGLTPIVTVEAVRRLRNSERLTPLLYWWIAGIALLGGGLTAVVSVIPDSIGVKLLGETWYGAASIFPILAAQIVFRGPNTGIPIILRAAHKMRAVVTVRVIHSVTTLTITTGGAILFGLHGAAWGWLLSSMLLCFYSVVVYIKFLRERKGVGN